MRSEKAKAVLVDSHVHIHNRSHLNQFLDQAYNNFSSANRMIGMAHSFVGVLMFAEPVAEHLFVELAAMAEGPSVSSGKEDSKWMLRRTQESCSLLVRKGKAILVVIAGRQVATAEDLEVLIFGTQQPVPDGLPIKDVLRLARSLGSIHVIPWGAGKWLFERGRIIAGLIDTNSRDGFYLGDQGGRPVFWPKPRHFEHARQQGIRILPGSDPLPFSGESERAGSFGFFLDVSIDLTRPTESLKAHLRNPRVPILPFGRLQAPQRFLCNQVRMQILKRQRRHGLATSRRLASKS